MTEFGLATHILEKLISVFECYDAIDKVVIYGSRANGTFSSSSDIDLAISAPKLEKRDFIKCCFEIEALPIIFKIDIVHLDHLSNQALIARINAEGKIIYPS